MLLFFQARSLQYCEAIAEATGAELSVSCVTDERSGHVKLPPPSGHLLPTLGFAVPYNSFECPSGRVTGNMGIDDESSHPELCSEVADGVTRNIVCLFREPDAVTPPVRFDKRGCGNVERWGY
jgi:hypothetical protein